MPPEFRGAAPDAGGNTGARTHGRRLAPGSVGGFGREVNGDFRPRRPRQASRLTTTLEAALSWKHWRYGLSQRQDSALTQPANGMTESAT